MSICHVHPGLTRVQPQKGRSSLGSPAAERNKSSHGREGVQPRKGGSPAAEGKESSRGREGVQPQKGRSPAAEGRESSPFRTIHLHISHKHNKAKKYDLIHQALHHGLEIWLLAQTFYANKLHEEEECKQGEKQDQVFHSSHDIYEDSSLLRYYQNNECTLGSTGEEEEKVRCFAYPVLQASLNMLTRSAVMTKASGQS
ncbi:hypothetical protein Tco_0531847 [Tanacetum coccineum]